MIRLFVGLELPEDIAEHIHSLQNGLPSAHWVDKKKLHLNLCFIGNVQEDVGENIHDKLCQLRFPSFNLGFKELGYFETSGIPHHLWLGVDYYQALDDLSAKITNIAHECGAPKDRFKFHAHVNLASLKGSSIVDVMQFISANNLFKTRQFQVYYFTLFSSFARENGEGKHYRVEARYPLVLG